MRKNEVKIKTRRECNEWKKKVKSSSDDYIKATRSSCSFKLKTESKVNHKMMRITFIAVIVCMMMQSIRGQISGSAPIPIPAKGQAFDLGRLFGGRSGEPVWTQIDKNLPQVQQMIDNTKQSCMTKLGMKEPQRSLIREARPTPNEKCLVECVLKGIKIVSNKKDN